MTPQNALPESMQVEELLRRDEFAEHKCLYELHATAWLVARPCDDSHLLRKSARQMLFHLQKMYEFTSVSRKMKHPGSAGAEQTNVVLRICPSSRSFRERNCFGQSCRSMSLLDVIVVTDRRNQCD